MKTPLFGDPTFKAIMRKEDQMQGFGVTSRQLMRTEVVDVIQKIQKHMVNMGAELSSEKYERWTEVAHFYQRILNRWPEEELSRWNMPSIPDHIERDLCRIAQEKGWE